MQEKKYFKKPRSVWFPDFEEVMDAKERRCGKYKSPFEGMLALLRYFRGEIDRATLISQVISSEAPQKIFGSDRELYARVKMLCASYKRQEIGGAEFDERLMLSFRDKPEENVFAPDFEQWEEITALIARIEQKTKRVPLYCDVGWKAYLMGRVTRDDFVRAACSAGEYLAQIAAYGASEEAYQSEIKAGIDLRRLCIEYKDQMHSTKEFDEQVVRLAKEFCRDMEK